MSPDLNPIEHWWGVLERRVEQRQPKSIVQLKAVITEEWAAISDDVCANLVHSMPRRIAAVIEKKENIPNIELFCGCTHF